MKTLSDRIIEVLAGVTEPMLPSQMVSQVGAKLATVMDELTWLKRRQLIVRHGGNVDGRLRYTLAGQPPKNSARVATRKATPSRKGAPKQTQVLALVPADGSAVTVGAIVASAAGAFTAGQVRSLLQELRIKGLVQCDEAGRRGPGAIWIRSAAPAALEAPPARLQLIVMGVRDQMAEAIREADGESDGFLVAKLVAANSLLQDAAALLAQRSAR